MCNNGRGRGTEIVMELLPISLGWVLCLDHYGETLAERCDYGKLINKWVWFEFKSAQDDCNGTCVKFRAWNPLGMEIW